MSKHTPMIVKAARALCRHASTECGVNEADNWAIYSDEFLADAEVVLHAVGAQQLLEALQAVQMDAVGLGGGENAISDATRAKVDAAIATATQEASHAAR